MYWYTAVFVVFINRRVLFHVWIDLNTDDAINRPAVASAHFWRTLHFFTIISMTETIVYLSEYTVSGTKWSDKDVQNNPTYAMRRWLLCWGFSVKKSETHSLFVRRCKITFDEARHYSPIFTWKNKKSRKCL